ncbi:MAG: ribbon-helix-helix protein, CopG family [Gaiellaceae bacterium]
MRTTVTLDPDVAARLRELARERDDSFTEMLNSTLRRGLDGGSACSAKPYRLHSRRLGVRPNIDVEHALRVAPELEDAETIRKLELRR